MREFAIDVAGMSCTGCERVLESRLGSLDCVDAVRADADAGRVVVRAAPDCLDDVKQAITGAGYGLAE